MLWRISVLGCDTMLLAEKFQAFQRIIVAVKYKRLQAQ